MITPIQVGRCQIGPGAPCWIVAEVAQAHEGSLGMAHAFIDAAAFAGVNAIKFQTHIAAAESTAREPFRVPGSGQDASRFDYWRRMEFTRPQWMDLARHARDVGLEFLSSPFSVEAADLLDAVGVPAWKVGSGEVFNKILLDRLLRDHRPLLISTGLCTTAELDALTSRIHSAGVPFMLYQCTTSYPCPPEKIGLRRMQWLSQHYRVPVGLSDHSGLPWPGIGAAALGAASIEVHITMSRHAYGPDVKASLDPERLHDMVLGIRVVESALAHDQEERAGPTIEQLRIIFGRSLVAARPLAAGTILQEGDLAAKKPGGGLPPSRLSDLIGRTIRRPLEMDEMMKEDDLK